MEIEDKMAECLHALTTIRLAAAINPDQVYIRKVVKRLKRKMVNKRNALQMRILYKSSNPLEQANYLLNIAINAYAAEGYDWREVT